MELPQPTTGSTKPGREPRGHFHSTLARTTFSVCFGESITLFTLLMFQGLDILDARCASPSKLSDHLTQANRSRMVHWQFSLAIILLSITVFIPLSFSLVLTYRQSANGASFSVARRSAS